MSKSKRSSKKRRASRKRKGSSMKMDKYGFVDCLVAGAIAIKTKKGNCLHMFDSISFMATDCKHECFEIEGLRFDKTCKSCLKNESQ